MLERINMNLRTFLIVQKQQLAKDIAKVNSLKTELIGLSPICDEDEDHHPKRMFETKS